MDSTSKKKTRQTTLKNKVTIFSNGMADFQRVIPVKGGETKEIVIPVKKNCIGDILASLNVYGDVDVTVPAHYSSSDDSKLSIESEDCLLDLASKLSGTKVTLVLKSGITQGTLVGVHRPEASKHRETTKECSLVMSDGDGDLCSYSLEQIRTIRIDDENVRSEVDKALAANFQKIKPESTLVRLTVVGKSVTNVVVHYTIPASAWKMSYRLRSEADGVYFEGFAVVDNNTEEDWKDFQIAVVTGEPITFSTDLAEIKLPQRSQVNLVSEKALGAATASRSLRSKGVQGRIDGLESFGGASPMISACSMNYMSEGCDEEVGGSSAIAASAEVSEIGDFCVFESKESVTIDAGQSAVIPVISTKLDASATILYFNALQHATRPYRAINFQNKTNSSLGKGVCTVYTKGLYAGSCIISASKPEEEQMLPHALETGVYVTVVLEDLPAQVNKVVFDGGNGSYTEKYSKRATYTIENIKDENFEFSLDCNRTWNGKVSIKINNEPCKDVKSTANNSSRVKFALAGREIVEVVVEETYEASRVLRVTSSFFDNLNITEENAKQALAKFQELEDVVVEREDIKRQQNASKDEQRRLIALCSADTSNVTYKDKLSNTEDAITKFQEEIETLSQKAKILEKEIKKMKFTWTASVL